MARKVRVAVVGVGRLGEQHARVYAGQGHAELAGVADVNLEKARKVAALYGTESFADCRELYGRVEAVSVAVPTDRHFSIASGFLGRGVHVLLEKPIAKTVEQARGLLALARANGAILQVGHVERFNPAFRELERKVTRPQFIECHRLSPYQERGTEVGVVLDLMIHDIDIILHLVRERLKRVEAVGLRALSGYEDIANARLLFEGGCVANVTASRVSQERFRKIRIFQDKCYISADYLSGEVAIARRSGREIVRERCRPAGGEPLKLEIAEFLKCARSGRKPSVSGEQATEALRVCLAIVKLIQGQRRKGGVGR